MDDWAARFVPVPGVLVENGDDLVDRRGITEAPTGTSDNERGMAYNERFDAIVVGTGPGRGCNDFEAKIGSEPA